MGNIRNYYAFVLLLGELAGACHSPEQCHDPGEVRACACVEGLGGQQRCLPERVWDHCECAVEDGSAADAAPVTPPDAAGASPPGDGAAPPASATDAAVAEQDAMVPPATADAATEDAALHDAGGSDAASPDAGGQDAAPPGPGPYDACGADGDCASGSTCGQYTAFPLGPMFSACAAACSATLPCPTPSGSFTGTPTCDLDERCRIDCTATSFPPTLGTCPAGMQCQTIDALGTSYCVHP